MMKYLSVLIVVLDQLSKFVVHSTMNLYDSFSVIPHLLNFTYIRNEGIAFGIYFEAAELCRLELNFPKKAMRYYEKIIFEFQDSIHFVDSTKYFRDLRNDH